MSVEELEKEGYLKQENVAKLLDLKPQTLKIWQHKYKDFPKPFRISANLVLYKKKEILDWIEKKRAN